MSNLILTRRGRAVRAVVLLALIVGAVALMVTLAHMVPMAGAQHVTDAQWRGAVAEHVGRLAR